MPTVTGEEIELFDAAFLRRLHRVWLACRRRFQGLERAGRRSIGSGASLEFADYRNYSRGDDYRSLDWKIYGRLGKLFLKLYEEEEDLPVYFLIDASQSMRMDDAPNRKIDQARRLAAALSYLALNTLDRVGAAYFSSHLGEQLGMGRSRHHFHNVLRFLRSVPAEAGPTNLEAAVSAFCKRNRRRGLVLLLSDFFDPAGYRGAFDLLRYHRFEVRLLQVLSAADFAPSSEGDCLLSDSETGESLPMTVNRRVLADYRRAVETFVEEIRQDALRNGAVHHLCMTDQPFDELVLDLVGAGGMMR